MPGIDDVLDNPVTIPTISYVRALAGFGSHSVVIVCRSYIIIRHCILITYFCQDICPKYVVSDVDHILRTRHIAR